MSTAALQDCLRRHHAHAVATHRLDDELGTMHGIAWADFVLLDTLERAGGTLPSAQLASQLGLTRSHLVLRVLPLEKVGWVTRSARAEGGRTVALRAPGRGLLSEARETAAAVCAELNGTC